MNAEDEQRSIHHLPRRKFLTTAGLAVLGSALLPRETLAAKRYSVAPAKIGLQLYTVRDQVKNDIAGTLHKIASVGFEAVETAFWPENISVKQAAKYLKDAGLAV